MNGQLFSGEFDMGYLPYVKRFKQSIEFYEELKQLKDNLNNEKVNELLNKYNAMNSNLGAIGELSRIGLIPVLSTAKCFFDSGKDLSEFPFFIQ